MNVLAQLEEIAQDLEDAGHITDSQRVRDVQENLREYRTCMSQQQVVDLFVDEGCEVATVGGYVRVKVHNPQKSCFGPVEGKDSHGWDIVEVDWEQESFLLAPPRWKR